MPAEPKRQPQKHRTGGSSEMVDFLIGVDGGGSGTRALLARPGGAVLGHGEAGPSALGQGIEPAWAQVQQAVRAAFAHAGLAVAPWASCGLAAGLSGANNAPWYGEFIAQNPGFGRLLVETDSFVMLVGAHAGRPGAIVAAGTGAIGEVWRADGSRSSSNGWGFPVGDEGSGAWLGVHAVNLAQQAMDGRAEASPLVRRVWAACGSERESCRPGAATPASSPTRSWRRPCSTARRATRPRRPCSAAR
jgi:glucosamine kinase